MPSTFFGMWVHGVFVSRYFYKPVPLFGPLPALSRRPISFFVDLWSSRLCRPAPFPPPVFNSQFKDSPLYKFADLLPPPTKKSGRATSARPRSPPKNCQSFHTPKARKRDRLLQILFLTRLVKNMSASSTSSLSSPPPSKLCPSLTRRLALLSE